MTEENPNQPHPSPDEKIIATVKFRSAGKQYDFDTNGLELKQGDHVVVETNRGRALGTIARPPQPTAPKDLPQDLKKVLRLATEADHNMASISTSKEKEAFSHCFERIRQRSMPMKLVKAEYLFDGSKIIFYFTADGRVDFRELVKDLAHHFHTRIEMRQIGVRDEAKLLGGIGICGRELCCGTFLTDFHPVSVRMAKQQGLALNPTKISGQCGRLLCCLGYEYDTYCKMAKKLPKSGSKVTFEGQQGEVVSTQTLSQTVTVRCQNKTIPNIPLAQLNTTKRPAKEEPPTELSTEEAELAALEDPSEQPGTKAAKAKQAPRGEAKPQRGARNKSGETRPSRPKRSGKPAQERGNRPKKNAPDAQGQEAGQRPAKSQSAPKNQPPKDQQATAPASGEDQAKKTQKRRSRNRRRPPRKP